MKKILNRILAVNLFLIILPLLSSIVTNICVLIVSMLGENVTHIDGYSTMGIIIGGFFIYLPLWVIALVIYIIFIILILIFAVTALCVSENENKVNVIWTNSTVNILSYIMLIWLFVYSIFQVISYFTLLSLCYNIVVGLIWCIVGIIYSGSAVLFLLLTVVHTGYIIAFSQIK